MTLFNPQYFNFTSIQKFRNVFSEVFLVQIRRKLWKIHSEVCIQDKKIFRKRVPNFKIKGKKGNPKGEKESGGGKRKILFLAHSIISIVHFIILSLSIYGFVV